MMGFSHATQSGLLDHCHAAVVSVRPKSDLGVRGTAVAIRSNQLMTCHHVVEDAKQVLLASHNPVFEGKRMGAGEVVRIDEDLDMALLRSSVHLPTHLQLEAGEIDDSMPLLVWAWPGWNAWEDGELDPSAAVFHPASHAAVMTDSWTENNLPRFSFAGHVEAGMSGSPVVSALSGKIVGVATGLWRVCQSETAREIAETWHLGEWAWNLSEQERESRLEPRPPDLKAIEMQLRLGMGVALGVKGVRAFLNSEVTEVQKVGSRTEKIHGSHGE